MAVSHQVVSNWRGEIQFLCFQDQCFQSVVCLWTACYWDPQWEGFKIRESFQKLLQFSSITQSFLTLCDPWTAARQASLSITNSWSLFKPISIKLVMPSNHLILLSPSPPAFNLSQPQGLFQRVSFLHQVAKVLEFQLQHQFFQWLSHKNKWNNAICSNMDRRGD